jgi:hypothetical protein
MISRGQNIHLGKKLAADVRSDSYPTRSIFTVCHDKGRGILLEKIREEFL